MANQPRPVPVGFVLTMPGSESAGKIRCAYCTTSGPPPTARSWWGDKHGVSCPRRGHASG